MIDWLVPVVVIALGAAWTFYLGYEYGQYRYRVPPCRRRHRDEL